MKLIVEKVYSTLMGASSDSNMLLFQIFVNSWTKTDKTKLESGTSDVYINLTLSSQKYVMCNNVNNHM